MLVTVGKPAWHQLVDNGLFVFFHVAKVMLF